MSSSASRCARRSGGSAGCSDGVALSRAGLSLGVQIGTTGARILAIESRDLMRGGGQSMLETMCIGGGRCLAAVWERA